MEKFKRAVLVILAGLFLIEAWLWEQFSALGYRLVSFIPYERMKASVAGLIERLPPPAVVPIFILPVLVILPFKLFGLMLIAHHRIILGGLVFLTAKMAGLAVTAFLYDLTKDKLMMMAWFRWVAAKAIALKAWAHDLVAPYKIKLRELSSEMKARLRVYLPEAKNQFAAQVLRIRRMVQKARS